MAFVSRSVVSRVINNHPNVSKESRQRVLQVIKEHNFKPNAVARSLATHRSHEICILAPRWRNEILASSYWSIVFLGLTEQCINQGYFASVTLISSNPEEEFNNHIINEHAFDGYVIFHREVVESVLPSLQAHNAPIVLIGHDAEHTDVSSIDVDNFKGAYQAVQHLINLGHQRIATITGFGDRLETINRIKGYRRALKDAGYAIPESYVVCGDYSHRHGFHTMQQLLDLPNPPSAIFCTGDVIAQGALLAIHKSGLSVPDDVAVVGFDDLPGSQYTIPPLTSVHQPIYEKGVQAAKMLIEQIEGKQKEVSYVQLNPQLVIRESCGASAPDLNGYQ